MAFSLEIDDSKCNGCGACVTTCLTNKRSGLSEKLRKNNLTLNVNKPFSYILRITGGRVDKKDEICVGCQKCVDNCPYKCIEVKDLEERPWLMSEFCDGCGDCSRVCPYEAIHLVVDDGNIHSWIVNESKCNGCGTCFKYCNWKAIQMTKFVTDAKKRYRSKQFPLYNLDRKPKPGEG